MTKWQTYRRDVYRAIDEMNRDDITVDDIVDFVRWGVCRESRLHYVRDAIRDMEFDGVVGTFKDKAGRITIGRTHQFGEAKIRNPWIVKGAKE